ncbi:MAG: SEL1-like repeat protein, partial [Elusimicrobiales bacterium]|nr:SEL1-like repeat protein [Elusimicrobiales bacterium]
MPVEKKEDSFSEAMLLLDEGRGGEGLKMLLKSAEEEKNGYAFAMLGIMHMTGQFVEQNYALAAEYLEKGLDLGDPVCAFRLGTLMIMGKGTERNVKEGVRLCKASAAAEYPDAQASLAEMYFYGTIVPLSYTKSHYWASKAAKTENPYALNILGMIYSSGLGRCKKNEKKAMSYYLKAAGMGFADAMANAAGMYAKGLGCERDMEKALSLYEKAGEKGLPYTYDSLGRIYMEGNGTEADYKKAAEYFRKAAEREFAPSQHNLAEMYYNGKGVWFSDAKALELFRKAAAQDYPPSMIRLAGMLFRGEGCEKNFKEAASLYKKC